MEEDLPRCRPSACPSPYGQGSLVPFTGLTKNLVHNSKDEALPFTDIWNFMANCWNLPPKRVIPLNTRTPRFCRIELKLGTEFNHDRTLLFFIYFRTPHCDISANVHSPPKDTYTVLFCVSYPCLTTDMTRFSNKINSLLKLRIGRDGLLFRNFTTSCHCHRVGLSSDIFIVRKHHRWFNSLTAYFLLTVIYIWYNCKLFVLMWNACEWLNKNSSSESIMKYHYNQKGDRE